MTKHDQPGQLGSPKNEIFFPFLLNIALLCYLNGLP